MNKSEIIKQIKQYAFTFVVQLKYREDERAYIDYYCSDSDKDLAFKIEDCFGIEEDDEYEIIYTMSNDFNNDNFLSDMLISELTGDCTIQDEDFAKYSVGYISVLYNECCHTNEGKQYKKDILNSVLKYLDLRRQKPIASHVINELFKIFGIEKDSKLNHRKQIELILGDLTDEGVIYQLSNKDREKNVRYYLDRVGDAYKIHEEKSQYRIGVLFLRLHEALSTSNFISPTFTDKNKKIKNYNKFMSLMASYYRVKEIKYRRVVLENYREKGMKSTLYSRIRNEHNTAWGSLKV